MQTRAVRWQVLVPALAVVMCAHLALAAPAGAATFGPWSSAVNVETIAGTSADLNTAYTEGCPIQAPDGLRLYMASNRPGGEGGLDIWVARRASTEDPWGAPEPLGAPVNGAADDFCPSPVPGGGLYFVSTRAGGFGASDIYFSRRNPERGWSAPVNLGGAVNSVGAEASPSWIDTEGERALYFSSTRGGGFAADAGVTGDADIYRSPVDAHDAFGAAVLVPGINTAAEDARPNLSKDGLEIVFDSTRAGGFGGPDIYAATRASVAEDWEIPANLGAAVNTAWNETRASLSRDGRMLVFGSNRPGSDSGSNDLYLSTRTRIG